MNDIRRYSTTAVVLLVALRLSLGWQLLYEGLWKIDTLSTPKPWTSAGYLKNSSGPLRPVFREMAGDPNDLDWLDYDTVAQRWSTWSEKFQSHYRLSEKQVGSLNRLLNGSVSKVGEESVFAQPLEALPADIGKWPVSEKIVRYDSEAKKLYVSVNYFMEPGDRAKLEKLVSDRTDEASLAFLKAVKTIDERQKKSMGYLRKLQGAVNGNPELLGNVKWQRLGKKSQYVQQLKQYEIDYAKASTESEWDHLSHTWGEIQALRGELTAPVKAMEADFYADANDLLTLDQHARGDLPVTWTALKISDMLTIVGLTALGTTLILGLFTRFSCVMAAFMLFSFYLAMPPWPGSPPMPGPEHSLFINKNLIEVIALCGLAALPTGIWFGLDRILYGFFSNWKSDGRKLKAQKTSVEVEVPAGKSTPATT
ncbi:MAG: hypothetical protein ABJZ55_05205 [Fuerstiella sp.]